MVDLDEVQRAYAAFNRRDVDALLAVMDPDVEIQPLVAGVTSVAPWHGHADVRRLVGDAEQRWRRFELRCDEVLEFGDRIVALVHIITAPGDDGVVVEGDVAHLIDLSDGLVTRLVAYRDRDAALAAARA